MDNFKIFVLTNRNDNMPKLELVKSPNLTDIYFLHKDISILVFVYSEIYIVSKYKLLKIKKKFVQSIWNQRVEI
jgi:hypothetical protein